ncbi:DUF488 domain-containing protein [Nocardia bhagyanarayanae]|uniref:Uncharacterized protein YeaO (DUF488 family) n=1 Tax=Nocardia bhagyanarayanae TaxID=1215925 RepID=A0A543EYH1_9NOCA|nr:DUF488 family protein [Nocardia bhagyanarayanae]TQM26569.1 uncharacterized protein YeaO (DUF488 family) [Nocardia bhagyanarayanae]
MGEFRTKRIYEDPSDDDGRRVLVDRLWPRGISKERARIDLWDKEITPSNDLRAWYHHDSAADFGEFAERYAAELSGAAQRRGLRELRELAAEHPVTLVTAAKDPEHSHVAVLLDHLRGD